MLNISRKRPDRSRRIKKPPADIQIRQNEFVVEPWFEEGLELSGCCDEGGYGAFVKTLSERVGKFRDVEVSFCCGFHACLFVCAFFWVLWLRGKGKKRQIVEVRSDKIKLQSSNHMLENCG
jgi:hypothetical protein